MGKLSSAKIFSLVFAFCTATAIVSPAQSSPTPVSFDSTGGDNQAQGGLGGLLGADGRPFTIVTFDAPGAGTGVEEGTLAYGINASGAITGYFQVSNRVFQAYVRTPDGRLTAIKIAHSTFSIGVGINKSGVVTGQFEAPGLDNPGYSHTPKGVISPIEARGFNNLQVESIDDAGAIAGTVGNVDGNMTHGFVRATDGTITLFDPPHSFGTFPSSIAAGTITGLYEDPGPSFFGFLRSPDGVFTSFKAPNGGALQNVTAINVSGTVTGCYGYYGRNLPTYGLIREADGSMTSFVVPGATNTYPLGINASGTVIGYYTDANTAYHGFERSPDGTITTFDAPGAGTTYELGTVPISINDAGVIAGSYSDQNWVYHGFVVTP
jgi:hypothetical protein